MDLKNLSSTKLGFLIDWGLQKEIFIWEWANTLKYDSICSKELQGSIYKFTIFPRECIPQNQKLGFHSVNFICCTRAKLEFLQILSVITYNSRKYGPLSHLNKDWSRNQDNLQKKQSGKNLEKISKLSKSGQNWLSAPLWRIITCSTSNQNWWSNAQMIDLATN